MEAPVKPENRELYFKAVELYKSGMGTTTIGRSMGVSPSTVIKWIRKSGVEIRGHFSYDKKMIEEYGERYLNGEKAKDLADELGMSRKQFTTQMNKHGFKKVEGRGVKGDFSKELPQGVPNYDFYVPTNRCTTNKIKIGKRNYIDCTYEFIGG